MIVIPSEDRANHPRSESRDLELSPARKRGAFLFSKIHEGAPPLAGFARAGSFGPLCSLANPVTSFEVASACQ